MTTDSSVASGRGSRIESYRARCVVEIVMDWWIVDGRKGWKAG
jgi:hypothetical protein